VGRWLGLGRKHFFDLLRTRKLTKGVTVFAKFHLFFSKVFLPKLFVKRGKKYWPRVLTVLKIIKVTFENVTTPKKLEKLFKIMNNL
jgi:hypothetical protein